MESKNVSIIIPIYNAEKFLIKCLDSVINQTLKNIEIIIVNDGSTDSSLEIVTSYVSIHSNIILINQENAGYAAAVNGGLDMASGEYITFVDGDDYIEHDMMETLYNSAKESDLDLVLCNWDRVDINGSFISNNDHSDFDNKIFDRNEIIREFLLNKKELVEGFSWNKLFRRSLLQEYLRFPYINYGDMPAIMKVLTKIKKCKYINKILYHYVQQDGSITHTKNINNVKNFVEAIKRVKKVLVEENLISEFKKEYYIYSSNKFITEYCGSRETICSSAELTNTFKPILQNITIKKSITFNKSKDSKLLIKVILYKMGLLQMFIVTYHKFRSIF